MYGFLSGLAGLWSESAGFSSRLAGLWSQSAGFPLKSAGLFSESAGLRIDVLNTNIKTLGPEVKCAHGPSVLFIIRFVLQVYVLFQYWQSEVWQSCLTHFLLF